MPDRIGALYMGHAVVTVVSMPATVSQLLNESMGTPPHALSRRKWDTQMEPPFIHSTYILSRDGVDRGQTDYSIQMENELPYINSEPLSIHENKFIAPSARSHEDEII